MLNFLESFSILHSHWQYRNACSSILAPTLDGFIKKLSFAGLVVKTESYYYFDFVYYNT